MFIFIIKIFENKNFLKNNYQGILTSILIFVFVIIPFLILINQSEPDYFSMIGVISLDLAKKIVSQYPKGKQQSAVMALLYIAQKHYLCQIFE